jgi:hypothetical protein
MVDTLPSLIKAIVLGHFRLIEPLLDLLLLPLSYHVLLLAGLLMSPFYVYAWIGLGIVFMHLAYAWKLGNGSAKDFLLLIAKAPGYLVWKLYCLPKIFKSAKKGAEWKRSERT